MTLSPIRHDPIRRASPIGVEALGVPFLLGMWNGKRPDGRFTLSAEATETKVAIFGGTRAVPAGSNPAALTNLSRIASAARQPTKQGMAATAMEGTARRLVTVNARTNAIARTQVTAGKDRQFNLTYENAASNQVVL